MAADSADPSPPERVQREQYGTLELLRTRKDDGRALTLYGHDEPDGDGERPPHVPPSEREHA